MPRLSKYETSEYFFSLWLCNTYSCLVSGKHRGSVFWILSVSEPVILYEHVIYILGNKVVFTTVIAVKPLLTGWCGSQRLVKCNVPQDSILAIAPLYWDSFFLLASPFFFFSLSQLPPPHPFFIFIVFLSHFLLSACAVKPSETAAVVLRQVFLARHCLHAECKLWWNPLLHDLIYC